MKFFTSLPKPIPLLLVVYSVLFWVFSIFSYALTDPNLVLISWAPYQTFQNWMWSSIGSNQQYLSSLYGIIVAGMALLYVLIILHLFKAKKEFSKLPLSYLALLWLVLFVAPLMVSMNALSHDVFNYIFNAKMAVVYGANPHVSVALDFPQDLWTRFMHNTHTAAPYGYGWTALSLIPFGLGFGVFSITWVMFRLFMIGGIFVLYFGLQRLSRALRDVTVPLSHLAVLFLNPLFLIETISSMHNDVWMMALAVWAIALILPLKISMKQVLASALLLIMSISIKYVTVVLVPIWLFFAASTILESKVATLMQNKLRIPARIVEMLLQKVVSLATNFLPLLISVLFILPLFTARSQQFHPWYLIWALVWIPEIKSAWWRWSLIALSISSLFRYLPWLFHGGYSSEILLQQKSITWLPFFLILVLQVMWWHAKREKA